MALKFFYSSIVAFSLAPWMATADQNPEIVCPGGATNLANGLSTRCDTNSLDNMQGRSPSQILYEIIMDSPLPNSTFYNNDEHVTCLFQNSTFGLSGLSVGLGPVTLTIPPINVAGTICLYPEGVPEGGLDLGAIRNLTKTYIRTEDCDWCGWITSNFFSKNESQEGFLTVDWKENANCIENCIDPAKNKTEDKKNGSGAIDSRVYCDGWMAVSLLAVAVIALL